MNEPIDIQIAKLKVASDSIFKISLMIRTTSPEAKDLLADLSQELYSIWLETNLYRIETKFKEANYVRAGTI